MSTVIEMIKNPRRVHLCLVPDMAAGALYSQTFLGPFQLRPRRQWRGHPGLGQGGWVRGVKVGGPV